MTLLKGIVLLPVPALTSKTASPNNGDFFTINIQNEFPDNDLSMAYNKEVKRQYFRAGKGKNV